MTVVASEDEAARAAECIGYAAVLKANKAEVTHKSEFGGVQIGLRDERAIREAFRALAAAGLLGNGVLLQKEIEGKRELLLAARADPVFGVVLAVGFGGVLTDVVRRGTIVLPPVTPRAVAGAFAALRLDGLLGPFRGAAPANLDALTGLADALIAVAADLPGIRHIELNPVTIDDGGRPWAVDALVETDHE